MKIFKIVSGAETGADRGGLDAAIEASVEYGGFVPHGRRAEDGCIPDKYTDVHETEEDDSTPCTRLNAENSTCTIIFTHGDLGGGSKRMERYCNKFGKPCLHVNLSSGEMIPIKVVNWLDSVKTLTGERNLVVNVAGQRESKAPGIQAEVKAFLLQVIAAMQPKFA